MWILRCSWILTSKELHRITWGWSRWASINHWNLYGSHRVYLAGRSSSTCMSLIPGRVFGGGEGDVTHGKLGGGHLLYWQCQIFGHCLVHVIAVKLCWSQYQTGENANSMKYKCSVISCSKTGKYNVLWSCFLSNSLVVLPAGSRESKLAWKVWSSVEVIFMQS